MEQCMKSNATIEQSSPSMEKFSHAMAEIGRDH